MIPPAAARQIRIAVLVIALVTMPMCAFLYRFGELLALALLGDPWREAGQMMVVLAPMLFSYSLGGITDNLFLSLGRVRALFLYDLCSLSILVLVMLYFRNAEITTIILARSVTGIVVTGTVLMWISSVVGVWPIQLVLLCAFPAALAALSIYFVPAFDELGLIAQLVCSAVIFCMLYLPAVLIFAQLASRKSTSWRYLLDLLRRVYRRIGSQLVSSYRAK